MPEQAVTYRYPFNGVYRVTCDFACHANRTPPSKAPGIDFACPTATTIVASAAGEVIYCHYNAKGGGLYVIVRHRDRSRTLYSHLSFSKVGIGRWLNKGQQIGLSGGGLNDPNRGNSTGPHLHWALWLPEQGYVDPALYLGPQEAEA